MGENYKIQGGVIAVIDAIYNRRSIRKYKNMDIEKEKIEKILEAGICAPSSKNRQPWNFIVVSGASKENMLLAMKNGLEREKHGQSLLPNSKQHLKAAEYTMNIMAQAPVVVLVVNPLGVKLSETLAPEERIYEICNAQSVGAAMENMTLAATDLGLGSLWICDIYFAHEELSQWLQIDGQLIAAMSFGYADETPNKRPRNQISDIVIWRS